MMDTVSELGKIVGIENVLSSKADMVPFLRDKSHFIGAEPIAVARPMNVQHVSKIMKFCNKHKINVVIRGGGSSLTGSSVPTKNSIVLDMVYFSKILEIHLEDQYVIVEPEVVLDYLNGRLSKLNYFYPPEPASSGFATVGGTISTNAGGIRAVRYGSTKEWVLGLELVLPTGEVIQVGGKTLKRSVGYDFTSLIVGSEGTLGVVTKAILKIIPNSDASGRIIAYYKRIDDAVGAVSKLKTMGIPLLSAELLDKSSIDLIRKYGGVTFNEDADCVLMINLTSTKESLERELERSESILKKSNSIGIIVPKSGKELDRFYRARRNLFEIAFELAERTGRLIFISDAVVPTSELPQAIQKIRRSVRKSGLESQLFSHIGDGNIHVNILSKKSEMKKVEALMKSIAEIALDHKGSVSGEHGIGLEKKGLLIEELKKRDSMIELGMMKKIKKVFDPNGILNKGKIFDY